MRRTLALFVLLALVLTGCDLPGQKKASGPPAPTSFPPADQAKDQAIAEKIVLTAKDMGEADGWRADEDLNGKEASRAKTLEANPGSSDDFFFYDSHLPICQQLYNDSRFQRLVKEATEKQDSSAAADGAWISLGEDVFKRSVSSSVEMYKDATLLSKEIGLMRDARAMRCMSETLTRSDPLGFGTMPKFDTLDKVTGGDAFGWRLLYTTHFNGGAHNVYMDVMLIQVDRAFIMGTFLRLDVEPSPSFERELVAKLRAKATAAMSGDPLAVKA